MITPNTLKWTPEKVRALRESIELTQEQFAHRIGVTVVTVNRWENGVSSPTGASIVVLNNLIMMIESEKQ